MYYFGWRELMPALLKINIPFGFASIAGGINESRSVFLPMFGGPFIALMTIPQLLLYLIVEVSMIADYSMLNPFPKRLQHLWEGLQQQYQSQNTTLVQ
jgi:hypothetical protein